MINKWNNVQDTWSTCPLYWNQMIPATNVNTPNEGIAGLQSVEAISNLSIPNIETSIQSKETETNIISKQTTDNPHI